MTARIQGRAKFRDGFGGESSRLVFLPRNSLWGASLAVLAMAAASPASAANFSVTSEAELRAAIDAANANADATDTITLQNDIVISDPTAFPTLANPVTINTGAFTLSGADIAAGSGPGTSLSFTGGDLITAGTFQGGDAAPTASNSVGGSGLSLTSGSLNSTATITGGRGGNNNGIGNPGGVGGAGISASGSTVVTSGPVTGGLGGNIDLGGVAGATTAAGVGGAGVVFNGGSLDNRGTIIGGTGGNVVNPAGGTPQRGGTGGAGAQLTGGTHVSNGTIVGGMGGIGYSPGGGSGNGQGGDGVVLTGNATLVNHGFISGANSTEGGPNFALSQIAGAGATVTGATLENTGTIRGGTGPSPTADRHAIVGQGATIITSGTITSEAASAILFTGAAANVLELRDGWIIESAGTNNVVNASGSNDTMRLGGDADSEFDLAELGAGIATFGKYMGFEQFEKTGLSTWTVTGVQRIVRPWDIYEGTLLTAAGSDLNNGPVEIFGGILAGLGTVGPTTNYEGGAISPGIPGVNNGIGTLTIDGDYTGNGGLLDIETVLGDDGSLTDLLQINGNTSGSTLVQVTNVGGAGAQTVEGIKIVNIDGTSGGDFNLLGDYVVNGEQAVIAGAYAYGLYQGSVSVPDDGDWYLRNILVDGVEIFQPAVPLYEAYAGTLQAFNQLGTLQQRVGNRSWAGAMGLEQGADAVTDLTGGEPRNSGLWARLEGSDGHFEPETTTSGTDYDARLWRLQAGLDMQISENADGTLIGGVNVFYGSIDSDVESPSGTGSIDSDGYGVGGTLTWYGNTGFYVDGQAQATWYDSDVTSDQLGALIEENDGIGYGLSIEAGKKIAIRPNWSVTPQAQLVWSSVDYDDFTDGFGTDVSLDGSDSLVGRLGITADYEAFGQDAEGRVTRQHFYGIGNLYYDFEDGSTTDVAGVSLTSENESLWGGLGIGGTYNWADDKYSVYGEALVKTGLENFGDSHVLYGTVGFRTSW